MVKKYQKLSIAHARNFRHKPNPNPTETIPEPPAAKTSNYGSGPSDDLATNPQAIDVDWEYECGYEGGVNRENSKTAQKLWVRWGL